MNRSEIEALKQRIADRRNEDAEPTWASLAAGIFWMILCFIPFFIF